MDAAVRMVVRTFDATMYASLGALIRHPHLVMAASAAAGLVGFVMLGLGVAGTVKARRVAR